MSASTRFVLSDPTTLDGLTDHCSPVHARWLRRRVLRIVWSAAGTRLLVLFVLILAAFAYSYGGPTAIVVAAAYLLLAAVLTVRVVQTAAPSRPRRLHGRRVAYVLSDGTAVIEARITGRDRNVVELSNHVKLPGTPPGKVRTMRRTLVAAILEAGPRIILRTTTRTPALARRYAEDFDAVAESLGLDRRSVTRPARAWERVVGLRTEVRLESGHTTGASVAVVLGPCLGSQG